MAYPSDIENITNVNPGDPTSGPSHSALHNQLATLITALMTKVGIDGSADTDSLDYKINNIDTSWVWVTVVDAIHDDDSNPLPTTTPWVVDWYTLQDGDKVYVKDSSTAWQINRIYDVSISGWTITYTLDHVKAPEEIVFAINGTVYWGQFFFGASIFIDWDILANIINATTANITQLDVDNITVNNAITIEWSWSNLIANVLTDNDDQTYNGSDPTWVLPSTPLTDDALHITTDSGTNLIRGVDYSISWNTITWIIAPNNGEWLYARWLKWQTNSVPWWQAYYEEFTATAGQDTFALNNTPAWANWIWVSTRSGLYGKQWATRDYTYDSVNNEIVFNSTLDGWDVVSVQYIGFVANPINPNQPWDIIAWWDHTIHSQSIITSVWINTLWTRNSNISWTVRVRRNWVNSWFWPSLQLYKNNVLVSSRNTNSSVPVSVEVWDELRLDINASNIEAIDTYLEFSYDYSWFIN